MEGTGDALPSSRAGFHILFVCTGNICRSPLAERLARSILGPPFLVTSAGVRAEPGRQMAEPVRRLLLRLGADPAGFVSRPLTPELVATADLVLTATTAHRAESVGMHLPAATRTFTIAEFGTLSRALADAAVVRRRDAVRRAHMLVEEARALRGLVRVDQPDIADPFGGSWWAYRKAGRRIVTSLEAPLKLFTQ
ncbi:hypothetical protein [Nonomuraea sp. NPDC048916]|uniref:arsenate reductase/protein-tyrosine-phosphatase family protein n=1 Tax=Nonomuraea sp. NPDC048916 TaxID=3154232 RepID=UPI0034050693